MKRIFLTTAGILAVVLFVNVPAAVSGVWNGNWTDSSHWSNGVPTSSDAVTFPAGTGTYAVTMNAAPGYAKTLSVDAHATISFADGSYRLEVGNADTTPYQSSTINGQIALPYSGSELRFTYNHSITGSGSVDGSNDSAKISVATGKTLTSTTTIGGPLTIDATSATFTNNGYVVADYNDASGNETLMLSAGTVNGSGEWQVNANGAVLQFGPNLTSAKLTGPFKVYEGTLDLDISVCTTGALDFQKMGTTNPKIDVAASCTFGAKQASCP